MKNKTLDLPLEKADRPERRGGAATPTLNQTANKVVEIESAVDPVRPLLQRALEDMPSLVHHPGAKEVAILSVAARGQAFAFKPVMAALDYLATHPVDWSRFFMVAHDVDPQTGQLPRFNWRHAPLRKYESLQDFYQRELEPSWGQWNVLKDIYDRVRNGEISEDDGRQRVLGQHGGDRRSEEARMDQRVNHTLTRGTGNRPYTLARLERDGFADLAAQVRSGDKSAHAAAIEAGFRRKPTPLAQILKLIPKLSPDDVRVVAAALAQATTDPGVNTP